MKAPDMVIKVYDARKGQLSVHFPYNPQLVGLVKTVPGRRYLPEEKCWVVPGFALHDLQSLAARAGVGLSLSSEIVKAQEKGVQEREELLVIKNEKDANIFLPTATEVRNYQRAGVVFLLRALGTFRGALLADDMGLGKTLQALSVVALSPSLKDVLVICPSTLKSTWQEEINKHYPQLTFTVVGGNAKERLALWSEKTRIKIANYELLLRDLSIRVRKWDLVIADEITFAKNYLAKRTRILKKLSRRYSLGLSGTPLENRLEELHSILDFVVPGLLGPGWLFVKRYCIKDRYGAIVGYRGIAQVKERISPHYIRRTKAQVLSELPPKTYTDVWVDLSSKERNIYDAIREQIKAYIEANPKLSVANVLVEMLRLKQCSDDIRLLGEDSSSLSTKIQALEDILEVAEGHQIVAYTQFARFAEFLAEYFSAPLLSGEVVLEDRTRIVREFQAGKNKLLISTEVGAYGITLTAADIIVHLDQPWNPARLRQREDRLHRLGQLGNVQVISLMAKRTIDEYIRSVIHRKRLLAASVFGDSELEGENISRSITKQDLLALLE